MSSFIQTVEADVEAAWGKLEGEIETGAAEVWAVFKATFVSLLPAEFASVKAAIEGILADGLAGDIAGVETQLLNLGGETLALVEKLGSATVQAIIGVVTVAKAAT